MDAVEILIISLMSFIFCGIFIEIYLIQQITLPTIETIEEIESQPTNTSDCYNLSFKETVTCLNDYVKPIYNYTVRPDTIKTLEDIKLNGGDCFDYSQLYKQLAIERGYNFKTLEIYSNHSGHTFGIIYNEKLSYCVLDQKSIIGCFN